MIVSELRNNLDVVLGSFLGLFTSFNEGWILLSAALERLAQILVLPEVGKHLLQLLLVLVLFFLDLLVLCIIIGVTRLIGRFVRILQLLVPHFLDFIDFFLAEFKI